MLTTELAELFLKRFIQYIPHKIIITNEKAIVIASSDKSRIGSFHEIAFKILKTDNLMILTEQSNANYMGSNYGVNSAVLYHGEKVGVIGLIGNPYEVRDLISIIRISMEQMLDYELSRGNDNYRGNLRTQFIHMLLYEDTAHTRSELSFLSSQLGFQDQIRRLPILISCSVNPEHDITNNLLELCRSQSDQDIVIKLTMGQILVFKSFLEFEKDDELFVQYKQYVQDYLHPILQEIQASFAIADTSASTENSTYHADRHSDRHSDSENFCRFLIGPLQNKLSYYRSSYNQCLWMQNQLLDGSLLINASISKSDDEVDPTDAYTYYFYDNIGRYIKTITPLSEFHRIFNVIVEPMDEEQTHRTIETLDTLHRHNYNMNSASQELGIHKNTLIFRFNKIKNTFHINPIQSVADREFIEYLVYYLSTPK